jgi:nucleotide-binding universal stress UspA family protein
MYQKLLLPYDGSEQAAGILHHAGEIAHVMDATVRVLYVADTRRDSVTVVEGETEDVLVDHGEEIVEEAGKTLGTLGVEYSTDVVQGTPAETIAEYAEQYDFDVVLLPTHGTAGLASNLLGGVTEKVVRLSPIPILTARMEPDESLEFPYERILVATDGSETARAASDHAISLARALDADLHVLSVVEVGPAPGAAVVEDEAERMAQEAIDAVESMAAQGGLDSVTTHLGQGSPADVIAATVEDVGAQAVVLGATGKSRIERILLGSVAEKAVRTVPVPVVTVRGEPR